MQRRGVGLQGLQKQRQAAEQFRSVGGDMAEQQMKQLREQFAVFQTNLETFAQKHKRDVARNPVFRQYFNDMCFKMGVDPLASRRGFWAQLLDVGDFYYELAVQAVETCLRSRASNGGLVDLEELAARLARLRSKTSQLQVSADDVERAIRRLKVLGGGFDVIKIGARKMVRSVPGELNQDHTLVMSLAQEKSGGKGLVTREMIQRELGWSDFRRVQACLSFLVKEGLVWVDDQFVDPSTSKPTTAYWFPSLSPFPLSV